MRETLIIKVLGKWWQLPVNKNRNQSGTNAILKNMPMQLSMHCDVIYNLTTREMIKNRNGLDKTLNDAVIMRMWLEDGLPIFEYSTREGFDYRVALYYQGLAA